MTPLELKKIMQELGYTRQKLAKACGYKNKNTIRRWRKGESPIPKLVAEKLLRELALYKKEHPNFLKGETPNHEETL